MGVKTRLSKNVNPLRLAVGVTLGVLSVGLITATIGSIIWQNRPRTIKLAAGNTTGESYILSQALAKVVKENYPRYTIEVIETAGTVESLQLLQEGKANFAAAQADVPPGIGRGQWQCSILTLPSYLYPKNQLSAVLVNSRVSALPFSPRGDNFLRSWKLPNTTAIKRAILSF
ncbi:MAG: hypothetical protein CV045_06200 [Cyanobacteria bacterium M5B4]|nr:MAG: hypothetical protein CV045_06200 [Cyanobacteria bacterium M5B4]